MEKRNSERVDAAVKVTYNLISREDLLRTLIQPAYRESTSDRLPDLSKKSVTAHAVTRDISTGGMAIVGEGPFPVGSAMEIQLHLLGYPMALTLLAEIVRTDTASSGSYGVLYRAGVKILAINKRDMAYLDQFLLAEKIRRQDEKK